MPKGKNYYGPDQKAVRAPLAPRIAPLLSPYRVSLCLVRAQDMDVLTKAMEMEHLPAVPEKKTAEYEQEIDALKQELVRRPLMPPANNTGAPRAEG